MKQFSSLICLIIIAVVTSCSAYENNISSNQNDGYFAPEIGNKFTEYGENDFVEAAKSPLSTFSVDADGASYAVMRRLITDETSVPSEAVRIEEFLNYFTFDYPEPKDGGNLSVSSEITKAPWNQEHYLLRFGIKGKSVNLDQLPPSNYVFLIDVSGSMSSNDKLDLAKDGFTILANNLRDEDRVSIVTYSGNVSMVLEPTLGKDRDLIKEAISQLDASGSTNGGNALQLAYDAATKYYRKGGNNRVIMATDGDFNVGVTNQDDLVELVEDYLDKGIYLTVLGFGSGNLNDSMMEQIANHGNGNYEYIDNINQVKKVFVNEATKLFVAAKDSKIQVDFNPDKVSKYRLIGYENRVMSNEDFDDDDKDAGEIGYGQTITALYEIIPNTEKTNNQTIADFKLKYKNADTDESIEKDHNVSGDYNIIQKAILSENQRFASALIMFGMKLKSSKFMGETSNDLIISMAESSLTYDPYEYRKEFVSLVKSYNR